MCRCSVKKGEPVLRKKVMTTVVICQKKSRHWKEGIFIYLEDNAGVAVNVEEEMKGPAITTAVSQEHLGCDRQSCCVHNKISSLLETEKTWHRFGQNRASVCRLDWEKRRVLQRPRRHRGSSGEGDGSATKDALKDTAWCEKHFQYR